MTDAGTLTLSELAGLADEYFVLNKERLAAQKKVDEMEGREKEIKEILIASISEQAAVGVAGKLCRVTVTSRPVPTVNDRDAFFTYCKRRGEWDLISWRPSEAAIKLRWDAKEDIPGVTVFHTTKLSVNKV